MINVPKSYPSFENDFCEEDLCGEDLRGQDFRGQNLDENNLGENDFCERVLTFAKTTTAQVGQKLLADFGQVQASEKSDGSLITQCDRWADRTLRDAIATTFPNHGVLTEETTHIFPANDWCWVVDPLDGTTNFAMGVPIWGISLGLLYQGTPIFGYVAIPPLNQGFHGFWPGLTGLNLPTGAFCNDRPIHTRQQALTPNHLFSFCTRSIRTLQREPAVNQTFPCKIRMLGVATYNVLSVATGAVLGAAEATPKVWDIAATWAIVQAAEGVWIPLKDSPFPLQIGENYVDRSYPTLVVARSELESIFYPLVKSLLNQ